MKKPEHRSEQTWRELVRQQSQSGLSVAAFCRLEGIKPGGLYGWRSRLRGKTSDGPERAAPVNVTRSRREGGDFIDLGALGSGGGRCEVRLDLGGGVVLHLVRS